MFSPKLPSTVVEEDEDEEEGEVFVEMDRRSVERNTQEDRRSAEDRRSTQEDRRSAERNTQEQEADGEGSEDQGSAGGGSLQGSPGEEILTFVRQSVRLPNQASRSNKGLGVKRDIYYQTMGRSQISFMTG
jgi:hypothetical protein